MAMTDIYTLLPQIQPYLEQCPESVVKQWLIAAAKDFCVDTGIWRESLAAVTSVADQENYTLSVTSGYEAVIARLLEVKINDADPRDPSTYTFGPSHILTLDPAHTEDDEDINIKVVYWPTMACHSYPDWLVDRWQRGFVAGALYTLKAMRKRPWSDPEGAMLFESMYSDWVFEAKLENNVARIPGNLKVTKREFY